MEVSGQIHDPAATLSRKGSPIPHGAYLGASLQLCGEEESPFPDGNSNPAVRPVPNHTKR